MKKQTLIYNEEVIEHKIDLFNRIEHILDTKFNEVPIDASTWLLFKEYFDMYRIRISRAYNSDNKNIYILLSDGRISTDINIDATFRSLIKTKDQLYNFLCELEMDHGIYNMLLEIYPSEEQNEIGELYIIKEIIYDLQDHPWIINNDVTNAVNDVFILFEPIFDTGQTFKFKGRIWYFIINSFIQKLFEGYELTTSYNSLDSVNTTIYIDHLSDDYKCVFKWHYPNEFFKTIDYLHSLLLYVQAHRQFYIFRSIVESIDIVNYFGCYIVDDEPLQLTVSVCYFGHNIIRALSKPYARAGKLKLYEPHYGLKITIDVETDDYNDSNTYHVACHMNEEEIHLRVNSIFRDQLLMVCKTLQMLTNKYVEYLI